MRPSGGGEGIAETTYRYWAFLSYSHVDRREGARLQRALETYRLPSRIVGTDTVFGPAPRRLHPIFRDRDELAASADLGEHLHAALAESRNLVVVCSPASARSRWVNEEIRTFQALGRADRVFCLIVAGEPHASSKGHEELECFPVAARFAVGPDGATSEVEAEPIAADARPSGDGRLDARLKLIAGMLGIRFDLLKQRDQHRRIRRLLALGASGLVLAAVLAVLAVTAWVARGEAQEQRRLAVANEQTARTQARIAKANETEALRQKGIATEQRRLAEGREQEVRRQLGFLQARRGVEQMLKDASAKALLYFAEAMKADPDRASSPADWLRVRRLARRHRASGGILAYPSHPRVSRLGPRGRVAVTVDRDSTYALWTLEPRIARLATGSQDSYSASVAFTPDESRLALAHHREVTVWEVGPDDARPLHAPRDVRSDVYDALERSDWERMGTSHWIQWMRFSPDGQWLYVAYGAVDAPGTPWMVLRYGASTGELAGDPWIFEGYTMPRGEDAERHLLLRTALEAGHTIRVLDLQTGQLLGDAFSTHADSTFRLLPGARYAVEVAPSETPNEYRVTHFDVRRGESTSTSLAQSGWKPNLLALPDGVRYLLEDSRQHRLVVRAADQDGPGDLVVDVPDAVSCFAFSAERTQLGVGFVSSTKILILDVPTLELLRTLDAGLSAASIAFSEDLRHLAVTGTGVAALLAAEDGRVLDHSVHEEFVAEVCMLSGPRYAVLTSRGIHVRTPRRGATTDVVASPDGIRPWTLLDDSGRALCIADQEGVAALHVLEHDRPPRRVAALPPGELNVGWFDPGRSVFVRSSEGVQVLALDTGSVEFESHPSSTERPVRFDGPRGLALFWEAGDEGGTLRASRIGASDATLWTQTLDRELVGCRIDAEGPRLLVTGRHTPDLQGRVSLPIRSVRRLDLDTGVPTGPWIPLGWQKLSGATLAHGGTRVVALVQDGIEIYDASSGEQVGAPIPTTNARMSTHYPDHLVVWGPGPNHDGTVFRVFLLETGEATGAVTRVEASAPVVRLHPESLYAFVDDRVYDLLAGTVRTRRLLLDAWLDTDIAAFTPNGRYLFTRHYDEIVVFDVERSELLVRLDNEVAFTDAALAPSRSAFAAVDARGRVHIVDLEAEIGDPERLSAFAEVVSGMAFDEAGSLQALKPGDQEALRRAYVEAGGTFDIR